MLDNFNSDNAAELAAAAMVAGGYFGRPYLESYRNATAEHPSPHPAINQMKPFLKAMEERIQEFEPEYSAKDKIKIIPDDAARKPPFGINPHASKASNSRLSKSNRAKFGVDNIVSINPYHDDASLAHELGHTVTQRTPIGNQIHKAKTIMRSRPNVKNATTLATLLAPALASYMQEGDDDFATALGLGLAINAPTLMDEAFATGEGFNLMNRAGKPGTMGQKARMAGSFLTYTMAPVISAAIGSTAGNVLEDTI